MYHINSDLFNIYSCQNRSQSLDLNLKFKLLEVKVSTELVEILSDHCANWCAIALNIAHDMIMNS